MAEIVDREHTYHAEATALSGSLHLPLRQEITPHANAKLHPRGGYLSQQAEPFRLESVLTYKEAHTQVTGSKETKPGHGWATLSTSMIEGLNILEVVTADRVVAQIGTEHPLHGYTPQITFLGTRFENLRIAGYPITANIDLNLVGGKPENDAPYTQDSGFVKRISEQHARLRGHKNAFAEIIERYNRVPENFASPDGDEETAECSLVHEVEGDFPGTACGHVLTIPHFGKVFLAEVRIEHKYRHPASGIPTETTVSLDMIRAEMGCIGSGSVRAGTTRTNGTTKP